MPILKSRDRYGLIEPNHPNQVKGVATIVNGAKFLMQNVDGAKATIVIKGKPYQTPSHEWWVDVETVGKSDFGDLARISLSDCGVVVNPHGKWGIYCWLTLA